MGELDEIRKKLKNRYILFVLIIILTLLFILVYISKNINVGNSTLVTDLSIGIIILEFILMVVFTHKLSESHRKLFKSTFVMPALKDLFSNLYYNPSLGIPYHVIDATNMMYMGDRYHSEDYVSGEYKGIKFIQADVHIEEKHESTDSDRNTHTTYVTIFKGRWMIFDFNKNFKANVQISQKGFGNSKVNRFFGKKENRFKKVNMESESFNKKFKVFAQNEHDAFYLITPSLMERIEKLAQNNKGKLLFCFIDNKLHIGIYGGKDSFEPTSVFRKLNLDKIMHDISDDTRLITQFVDELNLDNDLFKKGGVGL